MRATRPALVLGLIFAASAHAGTLSTSLVSLGTGREAYCMVSNVGPTPVTVTASLYDPSGAALTPAVDSCTPGPLSPGATCYASYILNQNIRCVVESSSAKVRAALIVNEGISTVLSIPATKK